MGAKWYAQRLGGRLRGVEVPFSVATGSSVRVRAWRWSLVGARRLTRIFAAGRWLSRRCLDDGSGVGRWFSVRYRRFSPVLAGSRRFLSVLAGSCRFSPVLAGSRRFLSVLAGSCRFSPVLVGSRRFLPVLAGLCGRSV